MSDNSVLDDGDASGSAGVVSEQRALRKHEHYQILVEHNPHPIAVHSGGLIVYVNRAAIAEIGATSLDELVGRSIADFIHPSSIPALARRLVSLTTDGDFTDAVEVRMVRFDGSVIDMEIVSVLTEWRGAPAYQVIFRNVTATKAAEEAIRHQVALIDTVSDAIIATDPSGVVVSWNRAAHSIYGFTANEAIGRPVSEALGAPVNVRRRVGKPAESVVHHAKDGATRMMRLAVSEMDSGYVVVCSDNTAQIEAETKFTTVVNSLEEGVLLISQDGGVEFANPAARRMFESEERRAAGSTAERVTIFDVEGQPIPPHRWPSQIVTATHKPVIGATAGFDRMDGTRVWLSCNGFVLNPNDPEHSSVVISLTDVTESRATAARLEYAADHDMMTDLPNRAYVLRRLTTILDERARQKNSGDIDVVMYIDLDKMKTVNDSHGHRAGDRALIAVSRRLRAALPAPHFVGRVGGDEFVAVLMCVDEADMEDISDDIHLLLLDPIEINGHDFRMRTSVGVVKIRDGEKRTAQDIIGDADSAMYQAKLRGGGHTVEYDKSHTSREITPAAIKLVR